MNANSKSDRSGKASQSGTPSSVNDPRLPGGMRAANAESGSLNTDQIFSATHRAVRESIEETFGKTMHDYLSEAGGRREPFAMKKED